jgi:transposase
VLAVPANVRIFLFRGAADMRKGFEGLGALALEAFGDDVTSGAYFVFINGRRDLMKVLYWDVDGLALWCKRLERGRFCPGADQPIVDRREFFMMLEGIVPKRIQKRYRLEKS